MNRSSNRYYLYAVAILCAGCSSRVATYPVSGSVKFKDGRPVRIGFIEFRDPKSGVTSRGKLNDAGAFQLGTFSDTDGAPAGDYQIIIVQFFNAPPANHVHTHDHPDAEEHDEHEAAAHHGPAPTDGSHPNARVAPKYADYSTSPLRATVRRGSDNTCSLVVTNRL
jgi:hypothetical protein